MTRHRCCAALLALAVALAAAARGQTPEFRADVTAAYVDVFVSKAERPVVGLRAADFELRDDGIVQPVEVVAVDVLPLQALLVFDTSGSLSGEKRAALRRAGETLLAALSPADEAGLIAFAEEPRWLARPTRDRDAVRRAFDAAAPAGPTAAFDALLAALTVSDPRGRALVILFTDGRDNTSVLDAAHLRTVAARTSAIVHLVTIRASGSTQPLSLTPDPSGRPRLVEGSQPTTAAVKHPLDEIVEATGGRVWLASSIATLDQAFGRIAATLATRYVLRYEPRSEPKPGWHRLEVKLLGTRADVRSRRGYWVPPP